MKRLTCEMCGSNDLVKQEGVFVCQTCGCKYSIEEAKKLMVEVEGTVEVTGSVKIDNSSRLNSMYVSAREAKNSGNEDTARSLYNELLKLDPSNWEPNFYSVYYNAQNCRIIEIVSAISSLDACLNSVLTKISQLPDTNEQITAASEVAMRTMLLCQAMQESALNVQKKSTDVSFSGYQQDLNTYISRAMAIARTDMHLGDILEQLWGDNKEIQELMTTAWKTGIFIINSFIKNPGSCDVSSARSLLSKYTEKAAKYDPSYRSTPAYQKATSGTTNGGCYIATCVYGSYDCPQVWTLRRYRDNTLGATWYGRMFIRVYYAISPTIVKWFGKTSWFKRMWQGRLDKMVAKLNGNGVEDTPYQDKEW